MVVGRLWLTIVIQIHNKNQENMFISYNKTLPSNPKTNTTITNTDAGTGNSTNSTSGPIN